MSEQPERTERTANEPPEQLTFAEAAERLNITADAVRMRVKRGKLASVRLNERTFVVWPQPEHLSEPNTERTGSERSERRSGDRGDLADIVEVLRSENAYLRQQLDHQTHIVAGLVQRLPELPASTDPQTMPQERDVQSTVAPEGMLGRLRRLVGR